jgi:cysteine-rich repeat protein
LSGTVSCTTVNGGTPISPTLPVGLYRIDGASCSGLSTSGNYQVTYTGGDFAVIKRGQGIHFPKPADLSYGTSTTSLLATVTSSLSVVFGSSTTAVCTVSGNVLTVVNGGTCTITASQPGDTNHNPATPVTQSFSVGGFMGNGVVEVPEQCDDGNTVSGDGCSATGVIEPTRKAQTITFNSLSNKRYGASPFTVSAKATSRLPVSFESLTTTVCTVSGTKVTIKAAGLCTIRANQAGNSTWAAATPVDRSFTVGFGISKLFPPNKANFARGSVIPVLFQLTGSNGKAIPSSVASSLGCAVTVSFNGGTPACASWVPIVNVFGTVINTPNNLTRGRSYPIVVSVTIGSTVVASATTAVIAR